MSLRTSPTLTPALLASDRRNSKQSTGPRTARGKAWSRLNRLRNGARSPEYINFLKALLDAPPGRVAVTAQALLQCKEVLHPVFIEVAELSIQAEIDICEESRRNRAQRKCENNLFLHSKPESY
jgi:hypothetical protein